MAWQDAVNIYAPVVAALVAAIAWTVRWYKIKQRRLKDNAETRDQETSTE